MAKPKNSVANKAKPNVAWHRHGVRIAHRKHSGRILPWHYTTYAVLYFLILVTGFVVLFAANAVQADPVTNQGSLTVNGLVPGDPPPSPATMSAPTDQQHFSTALINVSGDCGPNLFVEIYRNSAFAGAGLCEPEGTYQISLNLVPGSNSLVAKIKNGQGQYGPDSETITVFYDVPLSGGGANSGSTGSGSSSGSGSGSGGSTSNANPRNTFLLYTDNIVLTATNKNNFKLTYQANGGRAPYAIAIDWGDGTSPSAALHDADGSFEAVHIYENGGQFTIKISGTDKEGNKALIQTVVIVQSTASATPIVSSNCALLDNCATPDQHFITVINRYIWPATIAAAFMTLSFWLGERFVYGEWRRAAARP